MACHLTECGCMNADGEFLCAQDYSAMGWCQDDHLVQSEWCQDTNAKCLVCGAVWCGQSDDDLCTPTMNPSPEPTLLPTLAAVLTILPTSNPTLREDDEDGMVGISLWLLIGLAVGGGILFGIVCSWLYCRSKRGVMTETRKFPNHEFDSLSPKVEIVPLFETPRGLEPEGWASVDGGGVPQVIAEPGAAQPGMEVKSQRVVYPDVSRDDEGCQPLDNVIVLSSEGVVIPSIGNVSETNIDGTSRYCEGHAQDLSKYQGAHHTIFSPNHSVPPVEKYPSLHVPKDDRYLGVGHKSESPSSSIGTHPELPSPNWDPSLTSGMFPDLPSPNQFINTSDVPAAGVFSNVGRPEGSGDKRLVDTADDVSSMNKQNSVVRVRRSTENIYSEESGCDIYLKPKKQVTLGGSDRSSNIDRLWERVETEAEGEDTVVLIQRKQRLSESNLKGEHEVFPGTDALERSCSEKKRPD